MNWRTVIEAYIEMLRSERKAAENTVLAYRNDLGQFVAYLERALPHDADWASVGHDDVAGFISEIRAGYSSSTIARKIAALKALFAWLKSQGLTSLNPAVNMRAPKIERAPPRTLSQEETVRLLEAATNASPARMLRDRALLEFLYSTGMRVSEAIALRMSDLDLERGEARCAGRGARARAAPISPRALVALKAYLAGPRVELLGGGQTDILFLNSSGAGLTRQAVWLMTRQHALAAGLGGDVTPHTLRHSRAAHMLDEGVDPKRVQEWFGHANISTTQSYRPNRSVAVVPPTSG